MNPGAIKSLTWWREGYLWQMYRLEHGFVHLFGIKGSIPNPQLGSW